MTTLREFILIGSTLPTGNTVRDHLNNQGSVGTPVIIPTITELKIDTARDDPLQILTLTDTVSIIEYEEV